MAMSATKLMNFRVRPDVEAHLRAAAAVSDQSLTDFVIGAAEARATEILATNTVVPADYFDALLSALDGPAQPNEALRAAARRPRRVKRA
jgi:uncharacterized protein (DUF1778 family)